MKSPAPNLETFIRAIIGDFSNRSEGISYEDFVIQQCIKYSGLKLIKQKPGKQTAMMIMPHAGNEFARIWAILTQEKKWKGKSPIALQMALDKLATVSESDAIQMMKNAIEGEWQGLYPLKPSAKPQTQENRKVFGRATEKDLQRAHDAMQQLDNAEQGRK